MTQKTATLRIKKVYYDKIKSGEKTTEFRAMKSYYHKLFKDKPTHLKLHYQDDNYLLAEVESLMIIPTPELLKFSSIPFGRNCYAIELKNVKEYTKGDNECLKTGA